MTTPQQIAPGQAEPEVPINENMAALGSAFVWAHDVTADVGLTVGVAGGPFAGDVIVDHALLCSDDATNYIVVDRSTLISSVDTATTDWDDTVNFGRVARVTFADGALTAWADERYSPGGIFDNASAALGAVVAADVGITDTGGYYTGTDVEAALQEIGAALGSAVTDVAAAIHGATGKTTPVDADEFGIADSAASFALKKLTWANLKATLKTYTDTLYAAIGAITGSGLTMATGKLLGRSTASTGAIEEITVGSGLSLSAGTLTATGTGGTVTTTGSPVSGNLAAFSGATSITNGDLSGDVTTSGTLVATIANDAVTYAKMQNVSATDKLLGRSTAGAGDVEEITCTAAGRALLDDADATAQRATLGLAIGSDVQAYDADLATIAGLTATTDSFLQAKSSAWASRTVAQVSADLQGTGLLTDAVGFRTIPQNSQSAAYTTVAADSGKHIFHPSADTTARTFTIDSNANVAYPIGTAITFVNQNSAGVVTIAITSDTMRLAGAGTTGSRTLAANGVATAIKVTSTEWIISGTGLT